MSYEVAALSFQAHTNYGTWSIDFDTNIVKKDSVFWIDKSLHDEILKNDWSRGKRNSKEYDIL